jgi:hypothetical protein
MEINTEAGDIHFKGKLINVQPGAGLIMGSLEQAIYTSCCRSWRHRQHC